MQVRLQKILAQAGFGSRRSCEKLILQGQVTIDGQTVSELGAKADPEQNRICVGNTPITREKQRYYVVFKPAGTICSSKDTHDRPCVVDLVDADVRLFTVGRLDYETEGLIFLTNDGAFANRVLHPRHHIEKCYRVQTDRPIRINDLDRLEQGVDIGDVTTRPARVRRTGRKTIDLTLTEGKKRQVRRMVAALGYRVVFLKRTRIGPVTLGRLKPGEYRSMTRSERAFFT